MKKNRPAFPKPEKPRRKSPLLLSWPGDVSGRNLRATVIGSDRALIENYQDIAEYCPERVLLRAGRGAVEVLGDGLVLKEVRRDALIVTGKIDKVGFPHD